MSKYNIAQKKQKVSQNEWPRMVSKIQAKSNKSKLLKKKEDKLPKFNNVRIENED